MDCGLSWLLAGTCVWTCIWCQQGRHLVVGRGVRYWTSSVECLISQLPASNGSLFLLVTKLPHQPLCDQLDPNPNPDSAMALKTPNYINVHYAVQNREEMGAAISKNSCELDSAQFKAVLDVYDQSWLSLPVPKKPDTMIAKLKARKKKAGEARVQEDGLGECCEYLNELMGRLPST